MATGDLYKLVPTIHVFGQPCQNAFWYRQRVSASPTEDAMENLAASFKFAWWENGLDSLLSDDANLSQIEIWNYTNPSESAVFTYTGEVGEVASPSMPSQWCVGTRYARPGAGWNYPRKRYSGFPGFVYVNNDIDAGIVGALTTMANAIRIISADADDFQYVIFRPDVGFGLGNPVITAEFNVALCNHVYDASQQTRKN